VTEVPRHVLEAFGIRGAVRRLPGGQGTSWRADWLVLKPHADETEIRWLAGLCSRHAFEGLRVPAPVPASHGRLVVDGWCATPFTAGSPVPDDDQHAESWLPVLAAGRRFHAAVHDEPPPPFFARRSHRWARADHATWYGVPEPVPVQVDQRRREFAALTHAEGLPDQLVHGDLSGNVLLAADREPAIIDISAYWRPAVYADAVVVIDALLWWRTEPSLIELAQLDGLPRDAWTSLLARAAIFRLLASSVAFDVTSPDHASELKQFDQILTSLSART
jgi:uncharacterized protein (TIGR02569 family)